MEILILNGRYPAQGKKLQEYLESFESGLTAGGAGVKRVDLSDQEIRFCTGCWSCWLATPGRCVFKDGMEEIYRAVLASDLVVWASPLVLGTVSALVKKTQDRLIPLVHPYIELVQGECHHRRRYDRYPDIGLIVEPDAKDGPEELAGVRRLFERFAVNLRGGFRLFATTDSSISEAVDAALTA